MAERPESDTDVAAILGHVDARAAPPAAAFNEVRDHVHAAWQAQLARRRRTRILAGSVAASLAAFLVVATWFTLTPPEPVGAIATVIHRIGDVRTFSDIGNGDALQVGDTLMPGMVETGPDGRLVLRTATGLDLRIGGETRLELQAADRAFLASGVVYIDSHREGAGNVVVSTPFGIARDIGTRFEVSMAPDTWRVQVRDGQVEMMDDGVHLMLGAAERASFSATGKVSRSALAANDPSWLWVEDAAPPFSIDGTTLLAFLEWVSAETGRPLRFATATAAADAKGTILHGSISGLTPRQSLAAVLATTDFSEVDTGEGSITINR